MFTLDADRRTPSVVAEPADDRRPRHDHGFADIAHLDRSDRVALRPSAGDDRLQERDLDTDDAGIRRRLVQDLDEADTAILTGRIEDAHRALIHAQDLVFERHLAVSAADPRRPRRRSTDLYLRITDRLIDANRFKDRAIIAECRLLAEVMADAYGAAIRRTPEPTLT